MDRKWLLGFIEGSGCFSIVIRKSNNHIGYQTIADFTIKLPLHQKPLLERIQKTLKVGKIYQDKKGAILKVTRLDDAKRLVRFFGKQRFMSESKRKEFSVWKECVSSLEKGRHHTPDGLLEIARMRDSIHTKNLWNKKNYCSLRMKIDPCHVYEKSHQLPEGCRVCWETSVRRQNEQNKN